MKRTAAVIFMTVAALACAALAVALGSVLTEAMDAWSVTRLPRRMY